MNWVNPLVDSYYKWLREKTLVLPSGSGDWTQINTPFVGLFNDTIDIYAQRSENMLTLSDNGDTLHNLELAGVMTQGSKKRKEIINSILLNYGITSNDGELVVKADEQSFAQKKHNLLSAILEIGDLYVLSKHQVASIFKEDVRAYLDKSGVIYTPDFISKGETGLEFTFDFQIAHRSKEIVLKSFNSISKLNLPTFLFSWEDIKPVREKISKKQVEAIAIINDEDNEVHPEFLTALKSKEADFILWTERDKSENLAKLAA
jgi:hypothetical protein